MRKHSCVWAKSWRTAAVAVTALGSAVAVGCATPQYTIRPTPLPDESPSALQIERVISAAQAKEFERQGAQAIQPGDRLWGFDVTSIVQRLGRVTERPSLPYRTILYQDDDPNAASLADGRIYLSSGMLRYLAQRGSRPDELAFVVAHELAHTVAQHLVKRYRLLQQQQLLMALAAAGASALTRNAGIGAQQAGRLALDVASLLRDVADSGYSQEQELEADQLGIRYTMRAGFKPQAALELLEDFSRFENPWPFLRTHPYTAVRRANLQRYLAESGSLHSRQPVGGGRFAGGNTARANAGLQERRNVEARRRELRAAQKLYPVGSLSWQNLQRQIDALERRR